MYRVLLSSHSKLIAESALHLNTGLTCADRCLQTNVNQRRAVKAGRDFKQEGVCAWRSGAAHGRLYWKKISPDSLRHVRRARTGPDGRQRSASGLRTFCQLLFELQLGSFTFQSLKSEPGLQLCSWCESVLVNTYRFISPTWSVLWQKHRAVVALDHLWIWSWVWR